MRNLLTMLLAFAIIICFTESAMTTDGEPPDGGGIPLAISASEFHRIMAEAQARAWDRSRALSTLQAEAQAGQQDMDVLYYKLELSIDEVTESIDGWLIMQARAIIDGFSQAILNFSTGMIVDSVWENGFATNQWLHDDNLLTIDLGNPINTAEEFQVTVFYHGHPEVTTEYDEGLFFMSREGSPIVFSSNMPYGARTWWPCKDYPDDKADSADIVMTVNSDLFVSSNGILRDSTTVGDKTTYWWHEQYPITTNLISVAIADYFHDRLWYTHGPGDLDSMPIDFYTFPDFRDYAVPAWSETMEILPFFASIFGEYPFVEEKCAFSHWGVGWATEHQTNMSAGANWFGTYQYMVVHELAHMWWGDLVGCESWHHIWLNEGFASYAEALYAEHLAGADSLRSYMAYMARYTGGTVYVSDTTSGWSIFDFFVYDKGAWVVHMLRGVLGDDVFFECLEHYAQTPGIAYGTATTEDFQNICEAVSGLDLDYFFEQWVYDEYYPQYDYGFAQDPTTDRLRLFVHQVQGEDGMRPAFTMPVQIGLQFADGGDSLITVFNSQPEEVFEVPVGRPVAEISLDPDSYILKQARSTLEAAPRLESFDIDDPLGNGNGRADPGETGVQLILSVANGGIDALNLTVQATTSCPEITLTDAELQFGDVPEGETRSNTDEPILFTVDGDTPPTIVYIQITFTGNGGICTFTDSLEIHIGDPQVMIIDDDNADLDELEHYYADLFRAYRQPYYMWDKTIRLSPPADTMAVYPYVIWFTGGHRAEMLTAEDVAYLREYLDGGGKLFLTGQDIAENLAGTPDSTFLRDYLHVTYDPGIPIIVVEGVPGDPIGDGQFVGISGSGGAANQNSPDKLIPRDDLAWPIYTYWYSTDVAAVHVTDGNYRLVYFGFGFESVADGLGWTTRAEIFPRIYEWLYGDGPDYRPGDVNMDRSINPVDLIWLVNLVYLNKGPLPYPNSADLNADCRIDPVDVVILVNFVYRHSGELLPGCVE